jgi:GTP pyrophosphokinase
VPLEHLLQNGDIVEIITGKKDNPSLDWLSFARTAAARVKIKNWFKKQRGEIKSPPPLIAKEESAVKSLLVPRPRVRVKTAVKVSGLDNVLVRFSKCCFPIPGEEIVGFVTVGRGIAVHRQDCRNAATQKIAHEKMVKVEWNPGSQQLFPVGIEVEAFDRVGVFKDILTQISEVGTNVSSAKVSTKRASSAFLRLVVDVESKAHLDSVMAAIRKVSDVYNVVRK